MCTSDFATYYIYQHCKRGFIASSMWQDCWLSQTLVPSACILNADACVHYAGIKVKKKEVV